MGFYETRKEAKDACRFEANTAKRYSENAIRLAANGECSKAWDMADISRMAAKCAMQAHEELWALTEGKLTDDEFEAFEMAEIAQSDASRAEKAAAAAVEKQNKKSADGNRLWHEGALKVYGDSFHYWVKQYDTPSQYGIDGGRVSKLCIKRDGIEVCNYDRGWDIKPNDPNGELALEILLHEYNV